MLLLTSSPHNEAIPIVILNDHHTHTMQGHDGPGRRFLTDVGQALITLERNAAMFAQILQQHLLAGAETDDVTVTYDKKTKVFTLNNYKGNNGFYIYGYPDILSDEPVVEIKVVGENVIKSSCINEGIIKIDAPVKITGNGTAIVMLNPQYHLHKTPTAVKRNLLKIFPAINEDFKIHIILGDKEDVIDSVDKEIGRELCACILLGDKSSNILNTFHNEYPNVELLVKNQPQIFPVVLKDNQGNEKEYSLVIEGWIGAYKSTRGRKIESTDFPDNFISLYANDKMGEFNILPIVGANRLNESYVVGQLYIDLFELSELPDMALSNRQGYKSDDIRYIKVIEYVKDE